MKVEGRGGRWDVFLRAGVREEHGLKNYIDTKAWAASLYNWSVGNIFCIFYLPSCGHRFVGCCLGVVTLKVPKREIFVTELFTRSDPIWIGDMRTEPIKSFV